MENDEKGILVEQVIQADRLKYQGKFHEQLFFALRFLYFYAGTFAAAYSLADTFDIPAGIPSIAAAVLGLCIVFAVLWLIPVRKVIMWSVVVGVFVLIGFLASRALANGFAGCYANYAEQINEYYSSKIPLAADLTVSKGEYFFSLIYIMIPLAGILSAGIIHALDARLTALVFAVPLIFSLAVGHMPPSVAAVIMAVVMIGAFTLQYTHYRESFNVRTVTVRMGSNMFAKLRWQTAAVAAALFVLLIPVGAFVLGPAITDGYEAQSNLREDIRSGNIVKSVQDFWKKVSRGEWDWLPFDIVRSSGVHGGKLSNVKEIRSYDETHLYLDISSDLNYPMYIRGYVGSEYTGKGWRELSDENNDAGLASGFDVISLTNQYYNLLKGLYESNDESVVRRDLVITVADANSAYSYIPYGTDLSSFTAGKPFDAYPSESTDREILSMYYINTQRVSNINKLAAAGSGQTADDAYESFASSVYLKLPEEGLDRFYEEYAGRTFSSIGECVAFIRQTLDEHAEYTKIPGATHNADYVENFLYENKKGACTHFATAAVLLFRLYGIPARYVEGYYTTSLSSGQGAQEIKDDLAHAWAEIYLDGVGWLPIEVTPGFISEEDLLDASEEDESENEPGMTEESIEDMTQPQTQPEPETETSAITNQIPETAAAETETTQAIQSSSASVIGNDNKENSIWGRLLRIILIIIGIAALVMLAIFALIFRRKQMLAKQEEIFAGTPERAIRYSFSRLDELCVSENLPTVEDALDASELKAVFPSLGDDTLVWTRSLMQELTFSNHSYDNLIRDQVVKLYKEVAGQALEGCSGSIKKLPKKLWYLYGKCYA